MLLFVPKFFTTDGANMGTFAIAVQLHFLQLLQEHEYTFTKEPDLESDCIVVTAYQTLLIPIQ